MTVAGDARDHRSQPLARILVIDDEVLQMRALCETLRDAGYETCGFADAESAVAAVRPGAFDLVIADLSMPGTDGIEALRAVSRIDPLLVGVIMTGLGTIATAVESMKAGALDYVLKPFKLSTLLPVIERALTVRRLRIENAELDRRVRQRTAELEAANRELDSFAHSVSHDLRAPLRHMSAYVTMLRDDHAAELSEEARELAGKANAAAVQMSRLIEGLLRLATVGRQPLLRERVDLAPLVADLAREIREDAGARRIELRTGDLPAVTGDSSLLRQVFANLLANAAKFTRGRDPAVIEVDCRDEGGERVFRVRDNGAGFDGARAKNLFRAFHRMHSQEAFEGIGIGLSVVQRVVERHGGRVWAESEVDRGATFSFTLPR